MNPEQMKELIDRLLNTGEILATKGFELALQQIRSYIVLDIAWAIVWLIVCPIFVVITIKFYRRGKKEENDTTKYRTDEEVYYFMAAISGVFALLSLVGILFQSTTAYLHASNPSWYAVKLLVESFVK